MRRRPAFTTLNGLMQTETLAPYTKSVLPNGLRLLTSSMPSTRSVSMAFFVAAGSRYEREEEAGASHFLEHMLFKGTERRPRPQDISETIERVGGYLNASTDRETTIYWARVARPHLSLALDVLSDMLLNSTFPLEEMDKERDVILEEMHSSNDSPSQRAFTMADEMLWPGQALGRDICGTEESIRSVSRDTVMSYMRDQYDPPQVALVVAGQTDHAEIEDLLQCRFDIWPRGDPRIMPPAMDAMPDNRVALEYRRTEQANICLNMPGLSVRDPDRFALAMLTSILGDGMASRLFLELRERLGLVYDVDCAMVTLLDAGEVSIFAGSQASRGEEVIRAILDELERATHGVTLSELDRARELTKGRLLLRLEDTRGILNWIGTQEIIEGEIETPEHLIDLLDAVTPDDILRVAQRFFVPERYRLAVVGPYRSDRRFRKHIEGR